jgi:hypothetical protein
VSLTKRPLIKHELQLTSTIRQLFDYGGIISGGAALAYHLGYKTKDLDFYFNNDDAYIKAYNLVYDDDRFDICWYFDKPHELHDMSVVMCNLYDSGYNEITSQAAEALESGMSDLYVENIIWPERTARRMLKYHNRIGINYKPEQVLALCSIYKISDELMKQLFGMLASQK